MKYLFLILISLNAFAECEDQFNVVTEKDEAVVFCLKNDLQLSKKCASKVSSCQLVKDLMAKSVPSRVLDHSVVGNPGSRICRSIGWKVHMASLFDESQVCTCLHPTGELITCNSLADYFKK